MRKLSELYELLLDFLRNEHNRVTGLCYAMSCLRGNEIFTHDEYCTLRDHLIDNRPDVDNNIHPEFYFFEDWVSTSGYWWVEGNRDVRIRFVEKLIEELKQQENERTT